jgi:2-polyprenyl-6-methoxyphenol hydroxylase-like FAD-dependent oxidoreductase
MLQPTGLAALDRLGLRAAMDAVGHRITALHGMTATGRTIFDLRYTDLSPGLHAVGIHRAALHGVLWDAFQASDAQLRLGYEVASPDDPSLTSADLVIDASGARSKLRAFVSRKRESAFRYGAVWASVPDIGIADATLAQRYVAARIMLGYLPVGARAANQPPLAALFWSLRNDRYPEWRDGFAAWRDEAMTLWPELAPVLQTLDGPDAFTHATYLHFIESRPWRGNLLLTGDAAHTTSPQLGQGANQALIDAVVLADALTASDDLTAAFQRYAQARKHHVRFYQYASLLMTPLFQSDSRLLPALRDAFFHPMKHVPFLHREMLRTLAGLKTGLFRSGLPAHIVNQVSTPCTMIASGSSSGTTLPS